MELNEVTVLVTGAKGFIGQHLVNKLKSYNANVIALDKNECDVANKTQIQELIKKHQPKIIYHLAALLDKKIENIDNSFNTNVLGTLNILEAARQTKSVKNIILMGSSEDTNQNSTYGVTKKITSELGVLYAKNTDCSIVILKPFIVYGPGQQNQMFIPAMMRACMENKTFGMSEGKQKRDFVFVDDVVDVIILASLSNVSGEIIEIGTGKPVPIIALAETTQKLEDFKYDNTVYPIRPGEIMEYVADTEKAKTLLNWQAKIDLEEGIKKTLSWWKNERVQ